MRNDIDIDYFKEKLEEELALVEKELNEVGRKNPDNKADWEAEPADFDADRADDSEKADSIEEYEENTGILKQLEIQYNEVKNALERIEKGTYGICSTGGEEIETDRLDANPSATTCKHHIEKAS